MGDKAQYDHMTKDELEQEARARGIDVDPKATKDQLTQSLQEQEQTAQPEGANV